MPEKDLNHEPNQSVSEDGRFEDGHSDANVGANKHPEFSLETLKVVSQCLDDFGIR